MLAVADVAVVVKDARASARWWQEKVGFETHTVGAPEGHAVMVAPRGERFLLHLCEGFSTLEPGNTGIAFVTDEIDEQVERMVAAGVEFPEPLKKGEWGSGAKFADSDGNVFWLIGAPTSFIHREIERRAGSTPPPSKRSGARTGARRTEKSRDA